MEKTEIKRDLQVQHSVFGRDGDSELEGGPDWVEKASDCVQKKETKLEIQRALEKDPADEVDEQSEKKPGYVLTLMTNAERPKSEQELFTAWQMQMQREIESEAFKDKEVFITASYRKQLEEFLELDEEARRQYELKAFGDASKREDLKGFYRYIYRQTLVEAKSVNKQQKDSGGEEAEIERKKDEPDDKQSISVKIVDVGSINKRQGSQLNESNEHHKGISPTLTSRAKDARAKMDCANVSPLADEAAISKMRKINISCNDVEDAASKCKLENHDKSKQSPPLKISHKLVSRKQHTYKNNQSADIDINSSSSESGSDTEETQTASAKGNKNQTAILRQYRKRRSASCEESNFGAVLLENATDKDTDVSIGKIASKTQEKASELNTSSAPNENKNEDSSRVEKETKNKVGTESKNKDKNVKKEYKYEMAGEILDRSVYKKRTVGAKFEEARNKYLERKASRVASEKPY